MKYDLEISGFGSAALGHVYLQNLKDQTYPGSEGSKLKGWPTWTVPAMRWCKEQGGEILGKSPFSRTTIPLEWFAQSPGAIMYKMSPRLRTNFLSTATAA